MGSTRSFAYCFEAAYALKSMVLEVVLVLVLVLVIVIVIEGDAVEYEYDYEHRSAEHEQFSTGRSHWMTTG